MRRHLARISDLFMFGRYASVHCVLERLLQSTDPITISEFFCPQGHRIDKRPLESSNCEISTCVRPGMTLQASIDDWTISVGSRCPTCSINLSRRTGFVLSPPLLAFELDHTLPTWDQSLHIACGDSHVHYNIRGIIHHAGRTLVYNSCDLASISARDSIVVLYSRESSASL